MKTANLVYCTVLSLLLLTSSCIIIVNDKDSDSCGCCSSTDSEDQRVSLFDGKTLDGWTILKCEATVDSGDILIQTGNGLIQTEEMYGDFILEFEWKALRDDKWDSGVYFRYDSVPEGRPWPPRYQVNLRQDMEGNVGGLEEARTEGLMKAGKWNRFKLTVEGSKASLEMNGENAWEADGLEGPDEGFIALQAEVPGGGQHRFRKIYLTEL
jgi:hypothetical protein